MSGFINKIVKIKAIVPNAVKSNTVSFLKKEIKKQPEKLLFRDLDRIQTCNLLSRNQMRYSVAPRGLYKIKTVEESTVFCDDGRIQTCNLLSRNQMRYSVAPHRLLNS